MLEKRVSIKKKLRVFSWAWLYFMRVGSFHLQELPSCGEIQLFPLGGGNEEEEIVVAELKSRELDMVMPRKTN